MIYYEALASDKQQKVLHILADKRKLTKRMNVVCPNEHLAMNNISTMPEEVWCPFCSETYVPGDDVKVFTKFYGPGPRKLKILAEKYAK